MNTGTLQWEQGSPVMKTGFSCGNWLWAIQGLGLQWSETKIHMYLCISISYYLWLSILVSMCPAVSSLKKTALHIVVNEFLTAVFSFYQIFSQFQYFHGKKPFVDFSWKRILIKKRMQPTPKGISPHCYTLIQVSDGQFVDIDDGRHQYISWTFGLPTMA